jgi:hypothetical protein
MSWATNYAGSNNLHFGYPTIMNDGRNFSEWKPQAIVNDQIMKKENIQSNWEYRNYLTKNADSIMQYNQLNVAQGAKVDGQKQQESTNSPYVYDFGNSEKPMGHVSSDLKNSYLTRYQHECSRFKPSVSQYKLMK